MPTTWPAPPDVGQFYDERFRHGYVVRAETSGLRDTGSSSRGHRGSRPSPVAPALTAAAPPWLHLACPAAAPPAAASRPAAPPPRHAPQRQPVSKEGGVRTRNMSTNTFYAMPPAPWNLHWRMAAKDPFGQQPERRVHDLALRTRWVGLVQHPDTLPFIKSRGGAQPPSLPLRCWCQLRRDLTSRAVLSVRPYKPKATYTIIMLCGHTPRSAASTHLQLLSVFRPRALQLLLQLLGAPHGQPHTLLHAGSYLGTSHKEPQTVRSVSWIAKRTSERHSSYALFPPFAFR